MAEGIGFTLPRRVAALQPDRLATSLHINNEYIEAYINNNLPFKGEDEWYFNETVRIEADDGAFLEMQSTDGTDPNDKWVWRIDSDDLYLSRWDDSGSAYEDRIHVDADGDFHLIENTGGTTRLTIADSGNISLFDPDGKIRYLIANNGDHKFYAPDGTTVRFEIEDGADLKFFDTDGSMRYQIANSGDHYFYDIDGSTVRLQIADDGNISLYDADGNLRQRIVNDGNINFFDVDGTTERFNINNDGDINIKDQAGSVRLQYDDSNDNIQAQDDNTGQVEIFPKGTLIAAGQAEDGSPGAWTGTEAVKQTITVSVDYASQPVNVQMAVRARFTGFPDNSYARVRCGIEGSDLGRSYASSEVVAVTGAVSNASSQNLDVQLATAEEDSHTHNSGTLRTNSTDFVHGHSDTFAIDSDRVFVMDVLMGYEATASAGGDIDLELLGRVDGDASSETPTYTEISYMVWRR